MEKIVKKREAGEERAKSNREKSESHTFVENETEATMKKSPESGKNVGRGASSAESFLTTLRGIQEGEEGKKKLSNSPKQSNDDASISSRFNPLLDLSQLFPPIQNPLLLPNPTSIQPQPLLHLLRSSFGKKIGCDCFEPLFDASLSSSVVRSFNQPSFLVVVI